MELIDTTLKLAHDTLALISALRRFMVLNAALMAIVGVITLLNFWLMHRVLRVVRAVLKLVDELINERTR